MTTSISKRLTAAVGALALGILGAVAVATPASATEPTNPVTPTGVGNITGTQGTLTIHKYERTADSPEEAGTGEAIPGFTGIGLDGVEFTITKVKTDSLLTPEGWDDVAAITEAADPIAAANAAGFEGSSTVTTANGGVATKTLPYALYLVAETKSPSTVTDPVEPFLVTIPFPTGPEGENANQWIYDVHVYPKNAVTKLEKTVVEPTADELKYGDLTRWQITASVPVLNGEELETFTVTDQVDPAQLAFVTDAQATALGVAPSSVTVTKGGSTVALVAGDYSIAPSGADKLVLTFTAQGLDKLEAQAQGGTVTFTVLTQVKAVPANGTIENDAVAVVNGSELTTDKTTTVGQLRVLKFAKADGTEVALNGAKFKLFLDQAGTKPVTVAGASEWTTATNGTLTIPALRPGSYWLVETAAPAGYQLDATPTKVEVVAGQATTAVNFVKVENSQAPAWALPLTGGDGALWFGVGGAALVVMTVGIALLAARRRAAATA